ncbi:hypothetical protein ACP70R_021146 [Stipagrostis hirtigluma subsp. patula]
MAVVDADDAIYDDDAVAARILADREHRVACLGRWLNYATALSVAGAVTTGVGISLAERPFWPLGAALGSGYGGLLLVHCLFGRLCCGRYLAARRAGDDVPSAPPREVAHTWAAAAAGVLVFAAGYLLDTRGFKNAAAGLAWAVDAAAAAGVLMWWRFVGRDSDGSSGTATNCELTASPV